MTTPAPEEERPKRWWCRWETCPDKGRMFTPPPGVTVMADIQLHHRTVHGIDPGPGVPERHPRRVA